CGRLCHVRRTPTTCLDDATRFAARSSRLGGRLAGERGSLGGWLTCGESLDVSSVQRRSADAPVPAGDLFDHHPRDGTHVIALDLDDGVGHLSHDVLLLGRGEHSLNDLHVDERHLSLFLSFSHDRPTELVAGATNREVPVFSSLTEAVVWGPLGRYDFCSAAVDETIHTRAIKSKAPRVYCFRTRQRLCPLMQTRIDSAVRRRLDIDLSRPGVRPGLQWFEGGHQ